MRSSTWGRSHDEVTEKGESHESSAFSLQLKNSVSGGRLATCDSIEPRIDRKVCVQGEAAVLSLEHPLPQCVRDRVEDVVDAGRDREP